MADTRSVATSRGLLWGEALAEHRPTRRHSAADAETASRCREAPASRAPVDRGHTIIVCGYPFTWERVILPLASDGATIDMLLVGYRICGDERA
jgi:hypothetical protein